jgi:hypothetical protein
MYKQALAAALSMTLATPTIWAQDTTPVEAVELATALAENQFYLTQRETQLTEFESELALVGENGIINTEVLVGIIGLVGFASLTAYIHHKTKGRGDLIILEFGKWVSGLFAATSGVQAGLSATRNYQLTEQKKSEILAKIKANKLELHKLQEEGSNTLARYRARFPDIDDRLSEAIKAEAYRIPRFRQLRSDLDQLRNQIKNEERDVNYGLWATGGSLLVVANSIRKSTIGTSRPAPYQLVIQAALVLVSYGYLHRQQNQRDEALGSITTLETQIGLLEMGYKEALNQHLTRTIRP